MICLILIFLIFQARQEGILSGYGYYPQFPQNMEIATFVPSRSLSLQTSLQSGKSSWSHEKSTIPKLLTRKPHYQFYQLLRFQGQTFEILCGNYLPYSSDIKQTASLSSGDTCSWFVYFRSSLCLMESKIFRKVFRETRNVFFTFWHYKSPILFTTIHDFDNFPKPQANKTVIADNTFRWP